MKNYTIYSIELDEMHIKVKNHRPEIMLYVSLYNKAKQKIGQVYMSSEIYYSDVQYNLSDEIRADISLVIDKLSDDLFENYITYDSTS